MRVECGSHRPGIIALGRQLWFFFKTRSEGVVSLCCRRSGSRWLIVAQAFALNFTFLLLKSFNSFAESLRHKANCIELGAIHEISCIDLGAFLNAEK
jgi:hypothetical protein